MPWLCFLLLVFGLPAFGWAASHVVEWTYTTQPQDRGFVVERCVNQALGCSMRRRATVSPTTRRYTDQHVERRRSYCYQVGVRDQRGVYQWSNMVCSP